MNIIWTHAGPILPTGRPTPRTWPEILRGFTGALLRAEVTDVIRRICPDAVPLVAAMTTDAGMIALADGITLALRAEEKALIAEWDARNPPIVVARRYADEARSARSTDDALSAFICVGLVKHGATHGECQAYLDELFSASPNERHAVADRLLTRWSESLAEKAGTA